jgi:hypothetical protein
MMTTIGREILVSGAVSFVVGFALACILFGRLVRRLADNCKELENLLESRRSER